MSRPMLSPAVALCGAILLTVGFGHSRQPVLWAAPAELRAGEEAIKQALAEPTSLAFVETPLRDVLDFIQSKHKIIVMIDRKALDDVGLGADSTVTINISNVTLRSGLRLMLRPLDLTWIIADEVLLITTADEANNRLVTEVYEVGDLVTFRDEKNEVCEDYDTLVDTITSTVQPTTWEDVGGPGAIAPATFSTAKVLVVSQTQEVHEEIVALLGKIHGLIKQSGQKPQPPRRKAPSQGGMGAGMGMGGGMGVMGGGMGGGMGVMGGGMGGGGGRGGGGRVHGGTGGSSGPEAAAESSRRGAKRDDSGGARRERNRRE